MHSSLITGSMPGIAASTSDTCEFGSPPHAVEAPEKSVYCEGTWGRISRPLTPPQPPVAPLISFDFVGGAFIDLPSSNVLLLHALSLNPRAMRHKVAAVSPVRVRRGNLGRMQALARQVRSNGGRDG